MNNHNNNEKHNHSMMWMMVICCALPFAILLLGGTGLFSGGYLWPVLVGILALACIGMMLRGHGSHSEDHESHDEDKASGAGDAESSVHKKEDHSCCH